jgi:hypothetical protein
MNPCEISRGHSNRVLAVFPEPCVYREAATNARDRSRRTWRIAYESGSYTGLLSAVREGFVVSTMARSVIDRVLLYLLATMLSRNAADCVCAWCAPHRARQRSIDLRSFSRTPALSAIMSPEPTGGGADGRLRMAAGSAGGLAAADPVRRSNRRQRYLRLIAARFLRPNAIRPASSAIEAAASARPPTSDSGSSLPAEGHSSVHPAQRASSPTPADH